MTNIYIDATTLVFYGSNTGIQRLERNIIRFLTKVELIQRKNFEIHPVLAFSDKLGFVKIINLQDLQLGNKKNHITIKGYFYKVQLCLHEYWRFKRLAKAIFPLDFFAKWLNKYWRSPLKWIVFLPLITLMLPSIVTTLISVRFFLWRYRWIPNIDDILIIPGFSWLHPSLVPLDKIKKRGVRLVFIIHDLIPILYPDFVRASFARNFSENIEFVYKNSDLIIANSLTTKRSIEDHINKCNNSIPKPLIEYFQLGFDLDLATPEGQIRDELIRFMEDGHAYLSVGTIEPRKNYSFLVESFDRLWHVNPKIKLCIVGHAGDKSDQIIQTIHNHTCWKKSLIHFDDLSDTELAYCYKKSKALIYPSKAEGFGLPLVEALSYGCTVIASDIPIFREIGREMCAYFSLNDPKNLVNLILILEEKGIIDEIKKPSFELIGWKKSTNQLVRIIKRYFGDKRCT